MGSEYRHQTINDCGYQYLTTRDGTKLAIDGLAADRDRPASPRGSGGRRRRRP